MIIIGGANTIGPELSPGVSSLILKKITRGITLETTPFSDDSLLSMLLLR